MTHSALLTWVFTALSRLDFTESHRTLQNHTQVVCQEPADPPSPEQTPGILWRRKRTMEGVQMDQRGGMVPQPGCGLASPRSLQNFSMSSSAKHKQWQSSQIYKPSLITLQVGRVSHRCLPKRNQEACPWSCLNFIVIISAMCVSHSGSSKVVLIECGTGAHLCQRLRQQRCLRFRAGRRTSVQLIMKLPTTVRNTPHGASRNEKCWICYRLDIVQ